MNQTKMNSCKTKFAENITDRRIKMQEIDWEGRPRKRIEGRISELLKAAEESLKDPDIQSVIIRKIIPGRKNRRRRLPKED